MNWRLQRVLFVLLLLIIVGCGLFRSRGRNPEGKELSAFDTLSDYKNGSLQNLIKRPESTIKHHKFAAYFHEHQGPVRPPKPLPWVKPDLKTLTANAPVIV